MTFLNKNIWFAAVLKPYLKGESLLQPGYGKSDLRAYLQRDTSVSLMPCDPGRAYPRTRICSAHRTLTKCSQKGRRCQKHWRSRPPSDKEAPSGNLNAPEQKVSVTSLTWVSVSRHSSILREHGQRMGNKTSDQQLIINMSIWSAEGNLKYQGFSSRMCKVRTVTVPD